MRRAAAGAEHAWRLRRPGSLLRWGLVRYAAFPALLAAAASLAVLVAFTLLQWVGPWALRRCWDWDPPARAPDGR